MDWLYFFGSLVAIVLINEIIRQPIKRWEARCDRWARGFFRKSYLRNAQRWDDRADAEPDPSVAALMRSFAEDSRRRAEP